MKMPTPNWLEFSDLWLCGCSNATFKQLEIGEIKGMIDYCLVGDSYFLFHMDDISKDSICKNELNPKLAFFGGKNNGESLWVTMDCSRCKTSIGIKEENPQNNYSIRLFKDKISTDVVEKNSILIAYSIETRLASELIYLSQLHQTIKFALCSSITGNVVCLIMITHWENHISSNNRTFLGSELVPILKLQFFDCLENLQKSEEKIESLEGKF